MANVSNFSAVTPGAAVSGTLTDKEVAAPIAPQNGLRADGPRVTFHFAGAWSAENTYVYYDVVKDNSGASWICKYPQVPKGTPLEEGAYWTRWADPNIEVEELYQTVQVYDARITEAQTNAAEAKTTAGAAQIAADNAKTAADNAKTAADNAKTAADNAQKTADSKLASRLAISDFLAPAYVGDFVSYNGKFFGNDPQGKVPTINQGYCYNGNDHVFGLRNSDDSKQLFATASEVTNSYTILSDNSFTGLDHINCIAFNATTKHYYVYTSAIRNAIYILDLNFKQIKIINTPSNNYGNIAYDRITNTVWYVEYSGDIYTLENESLFIKKNYKLSDGGFNSDEVGQGCASYNNILVLPVTGVAPKRAHGFKVYDLNDGKFIKNIGVPMFEPIFGTYLEFEDCDFDDNGTLYISATGNNATDAATTYAAVTFLYKTDIYKNNLPYAPISPAAEYFVEGTYNGFKHYGTSQYPFADLAELNIALANSPTFIKKVNISANNNNAITYNGFLFFDRPINCNIFTNPQNNVTICGIFSIRNGGVFTLQNRLNITECNNAPFTYLVRVSNAVFQSAGINGTKLTDNPKVTNTMFIQGSSLVNSAYCRLDNVENTPQTSIVGGFGYVFGAPLKGKYVAS